MEEEEEEFCVSIGESKEPHGPHFFDAPSNSRTRGQSWPRSLPPTLSRHILTQIKST